MSNSKQKRKAVRIFPTILDVYGRDGSWLMEAKVPKDCLPGSYVYACSANGGIWSTDKKLFIAWHEVGKIRIARTVRK